MCHCCAHWFKASAASSAVRDFSCLACSVADTEVFGASAAKLRALWWTSMFSEVCFRIMRGMTALRSIPAISPLESATKPTCFIHLAITLMLLGVAECMAGYWLLIRSPPQQFFPSTALTITFGLLILISGAISYLYLDRNSNDKLNPVKMSMAAPCSFGAMSLGLGGVTLAFQLTAICDCWFAPPHDQVCPATHSAMGILVVVTVILTVVTFSLQVSSLLFCCRIYQTSSSRDSLLEAKEQPSLFYRPVKQLDPAGGCGDVSQV